MATKDRHTRREECPVIPDFLLVGTDVPVLDQSRLLDQFSDEPDIIDELRDLFLDDFPLQLAKIRAGLDANDANQVARAAHSLKGASGTFGAERVYQVSLSMEQLARDGKLEGVTMGYDLLKDELNKVVGAIQELNSGG